MRIYKLYYFVLEFLLLEKHTARIDLNLLAARVAANNKQLLIYIIIVISLRKSLHERFYAFSNIWCYEANKFQQVILT